MTCWTLHDVRALAPLLLGATLVGCQGARSPEQYRDATAQVIATRTDQVRACYDDAHKADPTVAGTVTVRFKVEADSGKFVDAKVVGGSAADAVKQCVVKSLDGAVLSPADKRDGDATFVWEFAPPKPTG